MIFEKYTFLGMMLFMFLKCLTLEIQFQSYNWNKCANTDYICYDVFGGMKANAFRIIICDYHSFN